MPANNQIERTKTQKAAQFQKGKSGNPAGRKPDTEEVKQEKRDAAEMAKGYTKVAILALVKVVETIDTPQYNAAAVVNAANSLLNRAWGAPTQKIEANVNHSHEINNILAALDERKAARAIENTETVPLIEATVIDAQLAEDEG